jgi:alpha-L-rhamnosidase
VALAFGLVPVRYRAEVGNHLVDTILQRHQGHLDTGIFGTRHLMDALADIGRVDVAMTVLGQMDYPGFGFQIAHGATTPWEQWSYRAAMQTHDHAMFAGINASFYTCLAGINPAAPGYAAVHVKPSVPTGLASVSAHLDTVQGAVAVDWHQDADAFDLTVTLPDGVPGTIDLPLFGGSADRVGYEGAGIALDGSVPNRYTTGGGAHHFTVPKG